MPQINTILPVLYEPNQPYHYHYDNLPLKNILRRIEVINIQVDINTDILRGASGNLGSLNSRLDISLEENGSLKKSAVDAAQHSIESHSDTENYVRMSKDERIKLQRIGQRANKFQIEVEDAFSTIGNFITIPEVEENTSNAEAPEAKVRLKNSSTIFFDFIAPDIIQAHSTFPPDIAHRHHYDVIPAFDNPSSPSFKNYKTTSLNTRFKEGTLRVYVNGTRITESVEIYVLDLSNTNGDWVPVSIETQSPESGAFSLSRSLSVNDVVRIDFDELILPPSSNPIIINYNLHPYLDEYWQSELNNQIKIKCQVAIMGSMSPPNVLWESSIDGGANWIGYVLPSHGYSTTTSAVSPGVINETLTLLDIGPSSNGMKFRVTNSIGGVIATSDVFTLVYPFASSSSSSS